MLFDEKGSHTVTAELVRGHGAARTRTDDDRIVVSHVNWIP
jgi:hypothetical protein